MSTTQLHPITRSATSTSSWKRLATVAAATIAVGLVPIAAANATTAAPAPAQPVAAAVTHDNPLDRDNDMQQQRQHDRQRDQRQDRRAETTILDQILLDGWTSSSTQL
ncbi:hypothetical protein CJ179_30640 [Rhodococcus sp. ACS1]|uniref:hypothetical protein n=1 Tax=Rhodococcus TaxID=1827 RepID=UPI000BB0EA80|nr:hypothetical protein [Rhodococcus sp. ACS1]PBC45078.1 hypothetical protein CJ179_30640 [Rhodococcus sp. ACS1]